MAGYTRQSAADIVPTAVVRSAPVNSEYNAIRDAFTQATGHKHDGSTAEGAYVPLIADTDANNKVVVDSTNNRHGVFVEVGGTPVEQLRIQDGAIVPVLDNDIDLGTTTLEFKNLYLDGVAKVDTLTVDENAAVVGTLGITGTTTGTTIVASTGFSGPLTGSVTGSVTGNLTGNVTGDVTSTGGSSFTAATLTGGSINSTPIGNTTPSTVVGTNITANTGFSGPLTGNVTGNVTGSLTGSVTGDVTGNLTGNVTSAGTSTFSNLTVTGTLNMDAGTTGTITNLSTPVNAGDAATKVYVDTSISSLVDSAPAALDTLNELAAALGDDANFATTVTNDIATKLSLSGGTMSGAVAMGSNKITGLGAPTNPADATTKTYVDTQDALKLSLTGGTMTGDIVMGSSKVTSTATPTADDDLTRKAYVDGILGSATAAADSAAAASVSESNAAGSATAASNSASAAATSETNAAASFDAFDDRYLGAKTSAPTLDNDGDALLTGAIYWDTTDSQLKVYDGSLWQQAAFNVADAVILSNWTITESGGSLYFAVGGTNYMKLDASGNLQITGTIDTVATIS